MKADVSGRERSFNIPDNGILLTKGKFIIDGDDVFLKVSDRGYDTLRSFLPIKPEDKEYKFGRDVDKEYTNDVTEVAINLRHFINPTYNKFDSSGRKLGDCNFFYEIVAVGRANALSDSTGQVFGKKIASLLQDTLCMP